MSTNVVYLHTLKRRFSYYHPKMNNFRPIPATQGTSNSLVAGISISYKGNTVLNINLIWEMHL
jgi:hypothetical protein